MSQDSDDSSSSADSFGLTLSTVAWLQTMGIRNVLIGGQAVIQAGYLRTTEDVDLSVLGYTEEMQQILTRSDEVGLSPILDQPLVFATEHGALPMVDRERGGRVDFTFDVSFYLETAYERAVKIRHGDVELRTLHLNDLLIHKVLAARTRDHNDCVTLMRLRPNDVDHAEVERWLAEFEALTGPGLVRRHRGWRREALFAET